MQVMAHHRHETAQMVDGRAGEPAFACYAGDIDADIIAARRRNAKCKAQKGPLLGDNSKRVQQTPEPVQKKRTTVTDQPLVACSGVPGDIKPGAWTLRRMWARGTKAKCKGQGCRNTFKKGAPAA